jgi:hypothetical protein
VATKAGLNAFISIIADPDPSVPLSSLKESPQVNLPILRLVTNLFLKRIWKRFSLKKGSNFLAEISDLLSVHASIILI